MKICSGSVLSVIGLVAMLSLGPVCHAQPHGYAANTRAYNLAHGRVVFVDKCLQCHENGHDASPFAVDTHWTQRLVQPLNSSIAHAINGHRELPTGADQAISDDDMAAAVAYVVDRKRMIASVDINDLPPPAAGGRVEAPSRASERAALHVLLMMLGKDRWK